MTGQSLTRRITWLLVVATVLVIGAAGVVMDVMVDAEMERRFDDNLLSQASTLTSLAALGPGAMLVDGAAQPDEGLFDGETPAAYAIQCASGRKIISEPGVPAYPAGWMSGAADAAQFTDLEAGGQTWRTLRLHFNAKVDYANAEGAASTNVTRADACELLLMQPRTELDDILTAIDNILLLLPVAALLLVLLISPLLVRRGMKPLATLAEEMRHIGPQALGQRLHDSDTRELQPLVRRFNEVLARMDDGALRERAFAGALAHETRTRLAELHTLVDVERRYPSGKSAEELLADVGSIGAELESIVSGLLLLTRLEAGIESPELKALDLAEHIAAQLKHIGDTLRQRNVQVAFERAHASAPLTADPSLLDIVLRNLLANAGNYTPAGGVIQIRCDHQGVVIVNHAPDLVAADVERFGQRYWSKHHGTGGHLGVGLALAGAAATVMQLDLQFSLDTQGRLSATLRWPRTLGAEPAPPHQG